MHSKNVSVRYCLSWMVLICALPFQSCTTKVLVAMDPAKLEKERLLHVKLLSGKEVKVKEPRFEHGKLYGLTPLYDTRPGPDKEIVIAVDQIESIRVERYDANKTIVSLTALAVATAIVAFALSQVAGLGELN